MRYERILAAVAATPWAIEPNKGREIAAILSRKAMGQDVPRSDIRAAMSQRKPKPKARGGSVALVPLHGVMVQRAELFAEVSGLISTEQVGQLVDAAAADPSIDAIVMDVDSPGGSVFGTAELAGKVAAAAKQKKVIAVANSQANSAAYYVASQASELVVTPSGMVGSIGVYQMHVDESGANAQDGLVVSLVSAGERKTSAHGYAPLDATGREALQEMVDGYYNQFVKAVANGRNVSQSTVRGGFGRGFLVLAEAAVKEGMADRVGTLDGVLSRYGLALADVLPSAIADVAPMAVVPTASAEARRRGIEIRRRQMLLSDGQ